MNWIRLIIGEIYGFYSKSITIKKKAKAGYFIPALAYFTVSLSFFAYEFAVFGQMLF